MTIYLRSSVTGKVLTQEEWQQSLSEWEDEGGSPSPTEEFIEVVKDSKGNWVEKNDSSYPS
ncbi:hypothetical protein EVY06_22880 [Citrobacter koseri]|uniref:hypothetical protein n=1 Tax=Citrobacter koseri TaxID=545 RepID=UPI000DF0FD3F|nr:hypothetical protein [Citrobacter koseri]MBJ8790588.1 hypothetical protein [Citrobacter koseri]MBJ9819305.1 hypothetical protein [Citrobacter koseri]MDT7492202.1 hypothetical protein [Citrobacter koseri]MDT7500445.1 hypothetical protein [Citrobacter koseri]RZA65254.1 hypothetical protein EVX99_02900 [Citrobacter koseri]